VVLQMPAGRLLKIDCGWFWWLERYDDASGSLASLWRPWRFRRCRSKCVEKEGSEILVGIFWVGSVDVSLDRGTLYNDNFEV
jgi:hypothetical protein